MKGVGRGMEILQVGRGTVFPANGRGSPVGLLLLPGSLRKGGRYQKAKGNGWKGPHFGFLVLMALPR